MQKHEQEIRKYSDITKYTDYRLQMMGGGSNHNGIWVGTSVGSFDQVVYNEIIKRRRQHKSALIR